MSWNLVGRTGSWSVSRKSGRLRVLGLAGIALAVLLSGCSRNESSREAGSARTSTPGAASAPAGRHIRNDQASLEAIELNINDVPGAASAELVPSGETVRNQVTLDICGMRFSSEAARVARRQVAIRDEAGTRLIGDEGVAYRSVADAVHALAEVRQAVTECDSEELVESAVAGVPPFRYDLRVDTSDPSPSTDEGVLITGRVTESSGAATEVVLSYMRRGRIVVGLYGSAVAKVAGPAVIVASRLGALPISAVSD